MVPLHTWSFCGFFVSKADTKLFNKASQVVIARQDEKTIFTMSSDFSGDLKEFAIVFPVPTVIQKEQVFVIDRKFIDHLDAYTAPRLVEYFDPNPCLPSREGLLSAFGSGGVRSAKMNAMSEPKKHGVTIESQYSVGEYDILILSAKESSGLIEWLKENQYKIPAGAEPVVKSYLGQNMKFFVAKVNIKEQAKAGFSYLRPLQVAYESPKFMIPVRLGTVNAEGPQELFIFALSSKGRVETTNYRTVKLPMGMDIPPYVKGQFGDFYRALFDTQVRKENMSVVFQEYAWDMNWCDPCAADPLTQEELKKLGVFWLGDSPSSGAPRKIVNRGNSANNVFVTRLHARYTGNTFPDDLSFQETPDRENFQGRYVLRHPWSGDSKCESSKTYLADLSFRQEKEATTLASLTGWDINEIRKKMNIKPPDKDTKKRNWWDR